MNIAVPSLARRALSLLSFCVIALLASFCGSSNGSSAPTVGGLPTLGANSPPVRASVTIPKDQLAKLMKNADTYQEAIIKDGVITFSEYQGAIFASAKCIEDAGFTVVAPPQRGATGLMHQGPLLNSRGVYEYTAAPPKGMVDTAAIQKMAAAINKAGEACRKKYSQIVEGVWGNAAAPTASEMQNARDLIAACLRDSGHDAPQHPAAGVLPRIAFPSGTATGTPPQWFLACTNKADQQTGIVGYQGQ